MKKRLAFVLCIAMLLSMVLAGCSKTIEVEADLSDLELEGALEGKTGEDYSATLVPDEGYALPEDITVKVDGSRLSDRKYDYDPESGDLEIPGEEITGDIEIIAEGEELTIVGAWEGTIDLTDFLDELISNADPDLAAFFLFSDLTLKLHIEFSEDGICEMTMDQESVEEMAEKLRDQMVDGMLTMLEVMSEESGMTADEFIQKMGYADAEAMVDDLFPVELLVNEFANLSQTSNYLIEDDLLYLSSSLDSDPKKVAPNPFELDGNTLTIEGNGDEGIEFMFPMVLKRVK